MDKPEHILEKVYTPIEWHEALLSYLDDDTTRIKYIKGWLYRNNKVVQFLTEACENDRQLDLLSEGYECAKTKTIPEDLFTDLTEKETAIFFMAFEYSKKHIWMHRRLKALILQEKAPNRTNALIQLYKEKGEDLVPNEVRKLARSLGFKEKSMWDHYKEFYHKIKMAAGK